MRIPTVLLHLSLLASPALADTGAELTVRIAGITSDTGHLLVLVAADEAAWNNQGRPAAVTRLPAQEPEVIARFPGLAPGRYAVQVLHDRNDNGQLDSNVVGMPIEPYGFSNNPQVMRRANFDEAAIDLPAEGSEIVIELN